MSDQDWIRYPWLVPFVTCSDCSRQERVVTPDPLNTCLPYKWSRVKFIRGGMEIERKLCPECYAKWKAANPTVEEVPTVDD